MDLAGPQLRLDLGMIANSRKAREVNDSFLLGRLAAGSIPTPPSAVYTSWRTG